MLADAGDAAGIASVHAAAWRAAFTFLPARFLETMTASAVLEKWEVDLRRTTSSMFVAVDDGDLVGFLQLRADDHDGEVMSLYVDPSRWDQGIGSALLAFAEAWLVTHGVGDAVLWTAKESRQSRSFYERRGWVASGDEQTQLVGPTGVALHEVEYRKSLTS
jgi:GNAT superfamily N-acetyltransferase